jgi:putative oxidoreductase
MDLALLALRLVVGGLLVGHGTQKLFGWFGGNGPQGTGGFFESLGLRPGVPMAIGAGAGEAGGGILIAAGLLTPFGAMLLVAVMATAISTVHWAKGLWATEGGYEYNLLIIAVAFCLAGVGPGAWSVDHALGIDAAGAGWALGALAVGLLGAAVTIGFGRSALGVREPRHAGRGHLGRA